MTTLAAPQSVTFTSTIPNGFINVDCSVGGEMLVTWVSPGSISGQRTVKGNAEDIGPFADHLLIFTSDELPNLSIGAVLSKDVLKYGRKLKEQVFV